jgi:hypothetical protein
VIVKCDRCGRELSQRQLSTLRHCELVKGHKEGNSIYLVPFDHNEQNAESRI